MIQTVTNNSPQQINAALFALDNSLENKTASLEKDIEALKKNIKEDNNDDGIVSGKTYDINISGNADTADYATRAEQDADGNTISSTYVKLEDLPNEVVTGVKGDAETTYRTGNVNITPANIGAATSADITNAINALDVAEVGGGGKYIRAISETDGKISATVVTMDTAPTADSTKAVTSGGIKSAIFTAETNAKDLANATGTLAIAHGGTGTDSQANINTNFIADLSEGASDVTDGTMFVSSYASDNGFSDTNAVNVPYKRKFSHVWEYIKGKISSVLGLTSTDYGGKASTAGTADNATNVNIATSNSNGDYPLLFTSNVTAGNKRVYTDTVNEASYNPSTNALKIKGSIFSNGYQQKRYYDIDASSLSTSNFYPVTFGSTDLELDCEIHSPNVGGGSAYNQNLIHFLLIAQGWSDTPKRLVVLQYGVFDSNEITLGSIAYGNRGGTNCIWVRGGLRYRFYSNQEPTLRNSNYTTDSQTFTVGSGYAGSGSNTNVTTIWTPDTSISASFSGTLKASAFNGNASSATKATQDGNGNEISTTYATKSEVPTKVSELANDSGFITSSGSITGSSGSCTGNSATATTATNLTGFQNNNSTGKDANTVLSNAITYYTSNGPTTTQGATTNDGALFVQAYSDNWVCQIAQDYRNGTLFVRGKNNGTWKPWHGIAKMDKVNGAFYALLPLTGENNWIQIGTANTSYGILPSQAGAAGSGHNYIGTSSWYWKYAYIDQIYGYLNGNISGSSTSCTGNSATATTAYKIRTSAPSSPEVGDIWIS